MKPKGQDTADAVRNWIRKDIEEGPLLRNKLGQFFFGVSTGTIGLVVGLKSFLPNLVLDTPLAISLSSLLLSSMIALYMACPVTLKLTGDVDLFELYDKQIRKIRYLILLWFCFWFLGVLPGIYSILLTKI